jgi:hypothetical protein
MVAWMMDRRAEEQTDTDDIDLNTQSSYFSKKAYMYKHKYYMVEKLHI